MAREDRSLLIATNHSITGRSPLWRPAGLRDVGAGCARQSAGVDRRHGPTAGRRRRTASRTALRTRVTLSRLPERPAVPAPGATALPEALLLVSALRPALQPRRVALVPWDAA